jgi:tetratricopeptide (TPR) repeat protein
MCLFTRLLVVAVVLAIILTAASTLCARATPAVPEQDVEIRAGTEKRHRFDEYAYREERRDDGTHVLGTIHGAVVWQAQKSPYVMQENVFVARDGILTIEPGVEVKVVRNTASINAYVCLNVSGTLRAEGTPDSMIRFTSASDKPDRYREWQGIVFARSSLMSILKWAVVEDAIFGVDAYGSALIAHCIFRDCHTGIYLEADFAGDVLHNVSAYNAYSGIRCKGTGAEATIVNNIFYENGDGIDAWWDAVAYADYNLYWSSKPGATTRYYSGMEPGLHDITADPRFVNAQQDNFRLADDSPARGTGFRNGDIGLFAHGWNGKIGQEENVNWLSDGARNLWYEGLELERHGRPSAQKYRPSPEKSIGPELRDKIACSLARVLISQAEYPSAKQILEKVILGSEFAHIRDLARKYLAEAWASEGKPEEALHVVEAVEWPQSKVWAKPALAKYKSLKGNYEEALSTLASLKEKEPYRYLKTLSEMVSSRLSAGQVDAAVALMKGFEDYPLAVEVPAAFLSIAKEARRQQRPDLAVELLHTSHKMDPFSKEAPESLLLLADILDQDMNRDQEAGAVLTQLCTNYFPFDPCVIKARGRINAGIPPANMMILLDASLGESSIFDRGPFGSCTFGQYGVIRVLSEAGYIVHTNDPRQGIHIDRTALTPDVVNLYGLIICNGRYGGDADPPIAAEVIQTLVEYVEAGGSLLIVAAGTPIGSGKLAHYYNPLVRPFGLSFVEDVDLPTKLATATDHPAVNGLGSFVQVHGAPVRAVGGDVLGHVDGEPLIALARYGRGKVIAAGLGPGFMGSYLGTGRGGGAERTRTNNELLVRLASYLLSPDK